MNVIGTNLNKSDSCITTVIELDNGTAVKIGDAMPLNGSKRIGFKVFLDPGTFDIDVAIREYPAATDNLFRGNIITRRTMGNSNVFKGDFIMPEFAIYVGEVSAIAQGGSTSIHVMEYF